MLLTLVVLSRLVVGLCKELFTSYLQFIHSCPCAACCAVLAELFVWPRVTEELLWLLFTPTPQV